MRATVTIAVALLALSCSGGQTSRGNTRFDREPLPRGATWAGIWFTNWGQMSVSTQGSSVVGEFCDDEQQRYGRVEGTAAGNVMSLHWISHDTRMSGRERVTEGSAIVQFRVQQQGEHESHHFAGTWGFAESNADGGPLTGERSRQFSQRFMRGEYEIPCEIRVQHESDAPMSDDNVPDNPGEDDYGEEEEEEDYGTEEGSSEDGDVGPLDL